MGLYRGYTQGLGSTVVPLEGKCRGYIGLYRGYIRCRSLGFSSSNTMRDQGEIKRNRAVVFLGMLFHFSRQPLAIIMHSCFLMKGLRGSPSLYKGSA